MVAYFKNEFTLFFGMSETKGYPWMLFLRRAGEACVSALNIGESLQINGIKLKFLRSQGELFPLWQ
jgi:hypothetical protein